MLPIVFLPGSQCNVADKYNWLKSEDTVNILGFSKLIKTLNLVMIPETRRQINFD